MGIVIGGTSLAAPLIAAYYAITGVEGTTPQWAYTNSAAAQRPDERLQRELRQQHQLHLQRRTGL